MSFDVQSCLSNCAALHNHVCVHINANQCISMLASPPAKISCQASATTSVFACPREPTTSTTGGGKLPQWMEAGLLANSNLLISLRSGDG